MKVNFLLRVFIGLPLLAMAACVTETIISGDPFYQGGADEPVAVKFSSKSLVTKTASTRTTVDGSTWTSDDPIGVYMLYRNSGSNLEGESENAGMEGLIFRNRKYVSVTPDDPDDIHAQEWAFVPATVDQTILYPNRKEGDEATPLRFIAYYPYKGSTGQDEKYLADISIQDEIKDVDFLYSENVTEHTFTRSGSTIDLEFRHGFARIIVNVRPKEGTDVSTSKMTGIVEGMPTRTEIDLGNGSLSAPTDIKPFYLKRIAPEDNPSGDPDQKLIDGKIYYPGDDTPYDAGYTAVILPHNAQEGERVSLFDGRSRNYFLDITGYLAAKGITDFEAGKLYTFWVTVDGEYTAEVRGSVSRLEDFEVTAGNNILEAAAGSVTSYVFPNRKDSMKVVYIPASTFWMGAPSGTTPAGTEENPTGHQVRISKGFLMGQTPVTWAQYAVFLNSIGIPYTSSNDVTGNISNFLPDVTGSANLVYIGYDSGGRLVKKGTNQWAAGAGYENKPVSNLYYYGAKAYAIWAGGDLPTEAQWELAARATTDPQYPYINNTNSFTGMGDYGVYNITGNNIPEVYSKLPNGWNLYFMFGLVWEWTRDAIVSGKDYKDYFDLTGTDPLLDPCANMAGATIHPLRGSHYKLGTSDATAHMKIYARYRTNGTTSVRDYCGFRVAFHAE